MCIAKITKKVRENTTAELWREQNKTFGCVSKISCWCHGAYSSTLGLFVVKFLVEYTTNFKLGEKERLLAFSGFPVCICKHKSCMTIMKNF